MRLLIWFLCLALAPWAAVATETERLLQAVEASGLPLDSFSLLAIELSEDGPLIRLSLHPHVAKSPASTTKLVTAAVVLKEIPVGTRFQTKVWSVAPLEQGILNGDLVLKGGGDPSFVNETLWTLVNRLKQAGLRAVHGDIVVDDSYFDPVLIDPSRDVKRSEQAYDAPVSALSFNWNSVRLLIRPGARVGDPARVIVDPPSAYIQLDNRTTTVAGNSIANLAASRHALSEGDGNTLRVSGSLGLHSDGFDTYRNITQPALWTGANLKHYLGYLGIQVVGEVRHGLAPDGAQLLASVEGRPIEQLVTDMNKVSSNFIAEMLTKSMAARRSLPGSMTAGLQIMNNYLDSLGLEESEYLLVNPSGLTHTNRLSAHALVQVLQDVQQDFRIAPEFIASLPVAGRDGTLQNRMRDTPAQDWVRAKTGYVEGAVSLAGFARAASGNPVLYAFLYNGPAPAWRIRALYDELSALLVSTR